MLIGCPTEIKNQEYRVGITPDTAHEAVVNGHEVIIQTGAGEGAGFPDSEYITVGARIVGTAAKVFETADMVVKVKEPQASERRQLREGASSVHLSTSRSRSGSDQRSAGKRCNCDCL